MWKNLAPSVIWRTKFKHSSFSLSFPGNFFSMAEPQKPFRCSSVHSRGEHLSLSHKFPLPWLFSLLPTASFFNFFCIFISIYGIASFSVHFSLRDLCLATRKLFSRAFSRALSLKIWVLQIRQVVRLKAWNLWSRLSVDTMESSVWTL